MLAARFALALVLLIVVAPPAFSATPAIHAHRGGTVENGKARYAEESLGRIPRTRPATASCSRWTRSSARTACRSRCTTPRSTGPPIAAASCARSRSPSSVPAARTCSAAPAARCPPGAPRGRWRSRRSPRFWSFARRTGAKVNLEIKNVPGDPDFDTTPAYANSVMDAVLASRIPRSQLLIQSFIAANLDVARQRMPGVATSLLSIQAINEPFLQAAADRNYDFISPEWPVSADYVRRAHGLGLDVAPFTLDTAADVRGAKRAKVDALITDDPLMAARALGLRPPGFFSAAAFIDGLPAHRHGRSAHAARRVGATGMSRHDHDARHDRQPPDTQRARPAEPQLRVPLRHQADPAAPGSADRHDPLQRQRPPAPSPRRAGARRAQAAGLQALSGVAGLGRTIPALPVRDVLAAVRHYRERFGFDAVHETDDFAVLVRDDAQLHLWGASDEDWRSRGDLASRPICSGAESFIAGTASCRIEVRRRRRSVSGARERRSAASDRPGRCGHHRLWHPRVRDGRPGRQPAHVLPARAGLTAEAPVGGQQLEHRLVRQPLEDDGRRGRSWSRPPRARSAPPPRWRPRSQGRAGRARRPAAPVEPARRAVPAPR